MKEIIKQSIASNSTHHSEITEYNDGSIITRVTGPSSESNVKVTTGTIHASQIKVTNTKER